MLLFKLRWSFISGFTTPVQLCMISWSVTVKKLPVPLHHYSYVLLVDQLLLKHFLFHYTTTVMYYQLISYCLNAACSSTPVQLCTISWAVTVTLPLLPMQFDFADMASKPDETNQLECPVCHEDYADPKILPCSHLTCYRCVVSLLKKTVGQGGCPVCRAPIAPPTSLGQGDFVTLVDALPTDLLMVDMVQSKELLGNSNVCCICENDIEATSYCFDCCIKLCKTCAKGHGKYPAFQDHVLEDLKKITVQSLVASRRPKCYSHSDRPAELYCCAHNKLICCECATDSHGACGDKKKIPQSATLKRAELRERAQRLKDKERALSEQVCCFCTHTFALPHAPPPPPHSTHRHKY